jgi:hypothetical protein
MRMKWGRGERTVGPSIRPVYTYAIVLISFLATLGIQCFRYKRVWTPLERYYFLDYLGSQIIGVVRDNGWYTLLEVVTRKGSRLALDSDVVPAVTASGENTFALRKEALKHGSLRLESYRAHYNNAEMHAYLGNMIYRNQTPMDLVRAALWSGLGLFFAGLLPATYLDQKRFFALRFGTKLRGPELMTVEQFNRPHHSRGMGLVNKHRTMLDRMSGLNKKLPVPLGKDNPQVLLMADPLLQEPLKMAAAAAGTDTSSQASGPRQESAPLEQAPSQDQKLEPAVAPTEKRFFE